MTLQSFDEGFAIKSIMTDADKAFIESIRWAVQSYSQESPPRTMRMMDRERLLKIINENFGVNLTPDLWCDTCTRDFILNAFQIYDSNKR